MATSLTPTSRYTVDDVAAFPDDGKLRELVDGKIVEWDVPSWQHGLLETELAAILRSYVRHHHLGLVACGEVMTRILSSNRDARGSDIEFRRRGSIPTEDTAAAATLTAPDFVIEVISPSDRGDMMADKIRDWLRAGVRLLWYVDPATGDTTVYQGDRVTQVPAQETLDGGDVVPGFRLCLRDVLDELKEVLAEC